MALINVDVKTENLTPVNGSYVFNTNFYNTTTGELLNDVRFPQNQITTLTSVEDVTTIPVEIANGNYPINNITIKIQFKDKVTSFDLTNLTVDCINDCESLPIVNIVAVNSTTYTITLSSATTNTYSYNVRNSSTSVASGTANVTGSQFNIVIPTLPTGKYLLELTGNSCRGKSIFPFNISGTLPNCTRGPILMNILNSSATSLQFQFDGEGVFGITWVIKQGTTTLRTGVIKHVSIAQPGEATFTNATPTISYGDLPADNYTLEISGQTCITNGVSPSKAFTVGGTPIPLAFVSGSPSVTGSTGNYTMSIAINKSGAYNTVILNSTTGTYYQNGNITYVANTPYVKTALPVGNYAVKVGTLETTLVIANTGGTPCGTGNGPTLTNVVSSAPSGLSFLFDGNGITAITWRIKQNNTTLRNGVVYPTSNTPFITYNELPTGDYVLEIEGNNCTSSVSTGVFTIAEIPQSNNSGVLITNAAGKSIGVIQGRYFKASVNQTTGAVRLLYDEISTADGSGTQVKGWLMGSELQEIKTSEKDALRSANGLVLPNGNYNFYLYYFPTSSVTTFDQIKNNIGLVSNENWPLYSKVLEEVIIEVRNLTV